MCWWIWKDEVGGVVKDGWKLEGWKLEGWKVVGGGSGGVGLKFEIGDGVFGMKVWIGWFGVE